MQQYGYSTHLVDISFDVTTKVDFDDVKTYSITQLINCIVTVLPAVVNSDYNG